MSNFNADEKYQKMIGEPVERLICKLAIPTVISMLVTSIYNIVDTYFVGKLGTIATGAVGISFAFMSLIQAIGFMMGMGTGNYISRLLGKKKANEAEIVATTGVISTFILGIIFSCLGYFFITPLVNLLGATKTIAPLAIIYIRYILIGVPFMASSVVLNNILRDEGNPFLAMFGIIIGGVLNILLDPLFIFVFNMGISGVALATVISQAISFFILLFLCGRGNSIKLKFGNFKPKFSIYTEILKVGFPSLCRQGLASIAILCLNQVTKQYGDFAIAGISIVSRIFSLALSILIGFGQGFQPVCGFNYGAGEYNRVKKAFWFSVKIAVIMLVIFSIIGFIFANDIVSLFRKDDINVINLGTIALKIQCVTFPLVAYPTICNMLAQTTKKTISATIIAISRQGIFFLPTIFILSKMFGLFGILISQSVADIFTFIITIPIGLKVVKQFKEI